MMAVTDYFKDPRFSLRTLLMDISQDRDALRFMESYHRTPQRSPRLTRMFIRKMISHYWENSSPCALDVVEDENIIVDERGEIKLIDLGSAAYVSKGPFDVFVSTVDYAAPEILEGMPYTGPPQDIWALGILLFTVVYRETPFRDVDEIMAANIQVPYDMSVECTNLIHLLLRRNLETRPTAEKVLSHPWISRST